MKEKLYSNESMTTGSIACVFLHETTPRQPLIVPLFVWIYVCVPLLMQGFNVRLAGIIVPNLPISPYAFVGVQVSERTSVW